jgi:iron-sulfur cluster assembly accessory protein
MIELPIVQDVSPPVTVAPSASAKLRELLASQSPNVSIRLFVRGMAGSGPNFGLALDDSRRDGDSRFESAGVPIVVDRLSATYIDGATVHYVETVQGSGFVVQGRPMGRPGCGDPACACPA